MIILVGPSASGKTEIAKALVALFGFKKFVTSTTHYMREGERDGVDYNFLSVEAFKKKIENNDFIEYVCYNGHYYGTEKRNIDNMTVLIVEKTGLLEFLKLKDPNVITYYLVSEPEILEKRMIIRGDKPENIKIRVENDIIDFDRSIKDKVDMIINTTSNTILDLALLVYNDYKKRVKL